MTKHEAVRRALAELGNDAKPTEIHAFVKEMFGFEMSAAHVSVSKSAILREGKSARKKPTVAPAPSAASAPKQTGIALEAVRKALAELGNDAQTVALQAFIKQRFGLDITTARIRISKREILREDKSAVT